MKDTELGPFVAVLAAIVVGVLAGAINGWLTAYVGLPAFIATLGTFYWARGIGSSIVAGTQLNGFPESFNLMGRSLYELLNVWGIAPEGGWLLAVAKAVSVQTIFVIVVALIGGVVLAHTPYGQKVYAIGGNQRAANFAGIDTRRARFTAMVASATLAACGGVIYDAFYRSFIKDGGSFVLPQEWQNVFIGAILIIAVVGDIWLRQNNILGQWFGRAHPPEELAEREGRNQT